MTERHILYTIGSLMLFTFLHSSCSKSEQVEQNQDDLSIAIVIDSTAYKYVRNFINEERERMKARTQRRIMNLDSTRPPPLYSYECSIDNRELSEEEFFEEVDSTNIKHFTRTWHTMVITPKEDEDTLVFSENGDRIYPQYEFITKLNAYSHEFVDTHLFDIEHINLHYTKHDVLYLSLGSSKTGAMNAQVYDCKTGGHITSFEDAGYNGSYYIGNGIMNNTNNMKIDNLNDIEKIRVVTMIDDQFSFREFQIKDIMADKEL